MRGLILPCCFYNEASKKLVELEIEVSEDDYEVAEITFYKIDAISPETHDDYSKTIVYIGDTNFLCPLPYKEVQQKIENWLE